MISDLHEKSKLDWLQNEKNRMSSDTLNSSAAGVNRTDRGKGPNRTERRRGLPDLVAQWFYKHGLFLSSYPTCASSIAIIVILLSCYPLLNIPLPGTIPTRVVLPFSTAESMGYGSGEPSKNVSLVKNLLNMNNLTSDTPFPWAQSNPYVYVQQILLKSNVHPWTEELRMMDGFRAPLYQVFRLLEIVRNHEDPNSKISLDHICLHVENVKRSIKDDIFPEYNCLLLSPANFWKQNAQNFSKDPNILNTIYQYHNLQKTKVSIAEMLFGLPMIETGFKRYPIKSRSRVIQYALTLMLAKNDQQYLDSLKQKLQSEFSLFSQQNDASPPEDGTELVNGSDSRSVMFIYYPGEFKLMEFVPITTAFLILFIYINFSLRKIEMVRSRIVLSTFAVITILGSLMMSLGLCFFFGLTISLQSKGIFPYLVILVGLENCLVITKSVITTDETFDIKIRIAQGLSKEGWHISKTLLTEITILTFGLATFVPVIQEFCIFAIVGLISDFFLQMLLFSTILALDIKRIEYTTEAKHMPKIMNFAFNDIARRNQRRYCEVNRSQSMSFNRSRSQPKLNAMDVCPPQGTSDSPDALNPHRPMQLRERKIPKRLRVVNLWTRTRFFQRAFMIWMSVWIFSIIHSSEFVQNLLVAKTIAEQDSSASAKMFSRRTSKDLFTLNIPNAKVDGREHAEVDDTLVGQLKKLQHSRYEINQALSNFHWSAILKQYNISLSGKYAMILPTIKLSQAIKPEVAELLRHPNENNLKNFQWKALAAALDPLDFNDDDDEKRESHIIPPGGLPMFPKSPMEIFLATLLCAISIFVLTYALVVFYRCVCTRNYAEWRSSWNDPDANTKSAERILEGVPIQVNGHSHKIECLVSDGIVVVSSCLRGQIKVWDSKTGELLTDIDRGNVIKEMEMMQQNEINHIDEISMKPLTAAIVKKNLSPIWCLDYLDNLVAVGCANGRLEFWEAPTGVLKCTYERDLAKANGVTHISLICDRVIVARLSGRLDFLKLETYYKGVQIDWGFTSAYRRTHVRTSSTGSIGIIPSRNNCKPNTKEEMRCLLENTRLAHQQPITCMEVVNGTIFTGSQDHTLRVYRLEDSSVEHTLLGHCGPITCLFVDQHWQFETAGSGSQDGLLCVWDIVTGACMYSIQAHYGSVTSLACAPSYIISLGTDERVCVWERFQGNLLCTINITNAYSNLLMLTPSLLVTSKMGSLMVWDVRTGEPTREVKLDCSISQLCPKFMILVRNSVICDYGNELRIVKFPMVADKCN